MFHETVKLGDKVEISKKKEVIMTDILSSIVEQVIDNNHMVIQVPIESGKLVFLDSSTDYYACIYTDRGLFRGEVKVTRRFKEENIHYLELSWKTPLKKYQRRQYYRMKCILNFQYQNENADEWTEGTLLDISGGGIRFSTRKMMRINSKITCKLDLDIDGKIHHITTMGTVVQSEGIEPDLIRYQNRIRFEELKAEDREVIIRFIFEEERRRRKRDKGMW